MIDSASALTGLALISPGGEVRAERVLESGRELDVAAEVEALGRAAEISVVAVALGPGSFTGLRAGVAYGLGLALGRGLPLLGLDNLAVCRARYPAACRGLAEAGRGRVYHAAQGEEPRLDEPAGVPRDLPAAGWLRPATAQALAADGLRLLPESELRGFGAAAAGLLAGAPKVDYGRVKLRYMQSFGAPP